MVNSLTHQSMMTNLNLSVNEGFNTRSRDVTLQAIEKAITNIDNDFSINLKIRKKSTIYQLIESDIFELKDAVVITANELAITMLCINLLVSISV